MSMKRFKLLSIVLLLVSAVAVRADKIDDYVKSEMQRQHLPGLSLAVIKEGKIIKAEGYGLANVELNVPARPDTVYKIGSVSKQFIASGIMLLVDEGRINLDDKVSKYLDGTPESWKDITVRNLLTHTSGIVREAPGFDPLKVQSDADVIKTAYTSPLRFAPGEKWEYCNVGYFTLAEIIHKVTGKSWGEFLTERIFAPSEMKATRTTTVTELITNRASGYYWDNGKFLNAPVYFALRPSGAFLSTVLDLAKWDAILYSDKVLKQSLRNQMWTPVKLNSGSTYPYGFGWGFDAVGGHKLISHNGALPGFRAAFARFVDDKLSIVILTNGDDANADALALGVADLYLPGLLPVHTAAKVDSKILASYAGQYQTGSSTVITVEFTNSKLTMKQGSNGVARELIPESESNFFIIDNRRAAYTFVKDASGQVTEFVLKLDGKETARAKKTK
ncbi:MAG: serine hydrolase [Blastocatellia bacterium]|nr:MAG: serine hydrolase [Blastocatellia bacterium]